MSINPTTGLYTAESPNGVKTIYAYVGSIIASASVTVSGVPVLTSIIVTPTNVNVQTGTTRQFTASGRDQNGTVIIPQPTFTWTTNNGSITSTGLLTAGAVATGRTVTATAGSISGTAIFSSGAAPVLTTYVVTPSTADVSSGLTQQYTAQGYDQYGSTISSTPVWAVNSSAGTLATITVTPNPYSISPNGLQTFTAVGKDSSNNVISGLTFVWTTTAGTITSAGLFTAPATGGSVTITATVGSISGTSAVTVQSGTTVNIRASVSAGPSCIISDDNTSNFSNARQGTGTVYFFGSTQYGIMSVTATQFAFAALARSTEGFVEFDTTSIPTNAVVTSATLTLTTTGSFSAVGHVLKAAINDFGAGALTLSDFIPGSSLSALTLVASLSLPSSVTNGQVLSFSNVAFQSNINKGGLTRIILFDEKSSTGTNPNTADYESNFCSPADPTTTSRPLLTVIYT